LFFWKFFFPSLVKKMNEENEDERGWEREKGQDYLG
jgi:hypothetical protein